MLVLVKRRCKRERAVDCVPIILAMLVPMAVHRSIRMPMHMRVAQVNVIVFGVLNVAPAPDSDPQPEPHQRDRRCNAHLVPKTRRKDRAGKPYECGDRERRDCVPRAGYGCCAGCLRRRPAAVARQQRNRRPVIGYECMQHADGGDGEDQEEWRIRLHGARA